MAVEQVVLMINTALTLSIGLVTMFIVYGSSKRIEDDLLKEFSRRLMLVVGVLVLYVFYWGIYNVAWSNVTIARYPLYLALIFVFLYLMWTVMSFEKLTKRYGYSQESKLEKMEEEELGGRN